ncbi:MAG: sulfite exporter TauE/SafE family protein [Candidatus Hydrogenedentes bacterium]|nr:sulfite exporter TauE/SafE family protein [Candidatus Hydrogenedentota bacterium]
MSEWLVAAGAAFWLGVLTSVSPCLLATNVAAISFLARRVDSIRFVLISCTCYIAGQAAAFVLLAMTLVTSLLSVPSVAHFLQAYMFRLLGPILIVCALFLFELFAVQIGSGRLKAWAQARANAGGFWVAALLGIVFAMSFCPTTAALFFGSLLPLAIARESSFFLPLVYAMGVAAPVIVFSLIIAVSANRLTAAFARVGNAERFARYATAAIFLVVGLFFTLSYTLELF